MLDEETARLDPKVDEHRALLLLSQACRNCKQPGHRIKACTEICQSCQPTCGVIPSVCPQYLANATTDSRQRKKPKQAKPDTNVNKTKGVEQCCSECSEVFASKTKLFKHLEVVHSVLGTSSVPFEKALLLVGWMNAAEGNEEDDADVWKKDGTLNADWTSAETDDKVLELLISAIATVDESIPSRAIKSMSRSTSCAQRASYSLGQEVTCNASCETFAVQVKKLLGKNSSIAISNGLLAP